MRWLAEFIGRILKHLLQGWMQEKKKPTEVHYHGGDDETNNAIDDDIVGSL